MDKIAALTDALLPWFAAHARNLPWRRTRDPYAIWVSEIMLQQTQVKTVIPYWERWMQALPAPLKPPPARPRTKSTNSGRAWVTTPGCATCKRPPKSSSTGTRPVPRSL